MKRSEIQVGAVYGYQGQRRHIYRYSPVMVIAKESYFRSRFGPRRVEPAQDATEKLVQGNSYTSPVGLLAVLMNANHTDHDSVRKLRALATVENAVASLNSEGSGVRDIFDTDDPTVILGTYMLMTDARHLHGDYHELVAELEASAQRSRDIAQRHEDDHLASLTRYRAITARLGDVGVMIAPAKDYDSPALVKLTFEQAERLVALAESAVRANKAAGIGQNLLDHGIYP